MLVTLVRTRTLLRMFRLDHLPQVLPTSFWLVPSSTPTRRRGRGTSRNTSPLCPPPILRPGRARTPALDLDLLRMKVLKAADRALASLNFSTTVSTEVPKSSEGETGASRRKPFSSLSRSAKLTHRCLSVTIMAAIDLPIAVAAFLVARRAKSVVRRSSATSSGDKPWPLSRSFSRSAWYAWSVTMVRHSVQRSVYDLTCCCICPAI